jgi:hypothetical protein
MIIKYTLCVFESMNFFNELKSPCYSHNIHACSNWNDAHYKFTNIRYDILIALNKTIN